MASGWEVASSAAGSCRSPGALAPVQSPLPRFLPLQAVEQPTAAVQEGGNQSTRLQTRCGVPGDCGCGQGDGGTLRQPLRLRVGSLKDRRPCVNNSNPSIYRRGKSLAGKEPEPRDSAPFDRCFISAPMMLSKGSELMLVHFSHLLTFHPKRAFCRGMGWGGSREGGSSSSGHMYTYG